MEHGILWGPMLLEPVAKTMAQWGIDPVAGTHALFVAVILVVFAAIAGARFRAQTAPEHNGTFSLAFFTEWAMTAMYNFFEGTVKHPIPRLFVLLATWSMVILASNLLGLIPGFVPPTDQFNVTFTLGLTIFVVAHFIGIREHGFHYVMKFMGPVWWLAPLMFPIEIMSNLVRPVSLSIRLFGNMFGDHKVVAMFSAMVAIGLPIPFIGLGLMVAVLQTFVFVLLSALYFEDALSHPH